MLGDHPGRGAIVATFLIVTSLLAFIVCWFLWHIAKYDKKVEREQRADDFRDET